MSHRNLDVWLPEDGSSWQPLP